MSLKSLLQHCQQPDPARHRVGYQISLTCGIVTILTTSMLWFPKIVRLLPPALFYVPPVGILIGQSIEFAEWQRERRQRRSAEQQINEVFLAQNQVEN